MTRYPAVAGQFYPSDEKRLRAQLQELIPPREEKAKVTAVISPHAGYVYSGSVAGLLYSRIEIPPTVIILGPNHTGYGAPAALFPEGEWITPLGPVPVEPVLSALVRAHAPAVTEDAEAHRYEHSLEVQVPFLRFLQPQLSIVPLCIGFGSAAAARQVGEGLAEAVREYGRDTLIVASSDMTHYETAESAKKKDEEALAAVMAMDPERLIAVCREKRITMCGVAPSAVMLYAARALGGSSAELVAYATSGDVSGDYRNVVAYAGVTVS
ncbi:MAG TPA: AmmeMemoRadiSam system protein B [Verrucomicrobiae bacterium]|nr:AmmeMemoRadiSam system protein B [Verrucomicrobiae bacterium]